MKTPRETLTLTGACRRINYWIDAAALPNVEVQSFVTAIRVTLPLPGLQGGVSLLVTVESDGGLEIRMLACQGPIPFTRAKEAHAKMAKLLILGTKIETAFKNIDIQPFNP